MAGNSTPLLSQPPSSTAMARSCLALVYTVDHCSASRHASPLLDRPPLSTLTARGSMLCGSSALIAVDHSAAPHCPARTRRRRPVYVGTPATLARVTLLTPAAAPAARAPPHQLTLYRGSLTPSSSACGSSSSLLWSPPLRPSVPDTTADCAPHKRSKAVLLSPSVISIVGCGSPILHFVPPTCCQPSTTLSAPSSSSSPSSLSTMIATPPAEDLSFGL